MKERFSLSVELSRSLVRAEAEVVERRGRGKELARRKLREVEDAARRRISEAVEHAREAGVKLKDLALGLGIPKRTLQSWKKRFEEEGSSKKNSRSLAGAKAKVLRAERRRDVIAAIRKAQGKTGARALCQRFGDLSTREAGDLLARFRRLRGVVDRTLKKELVWRGEGKVWAGDHATVPQGLTPAGVSRKIFAVRDLATGAQLAWRRVVDEEAETTIEVLEGLFEEHGAPLVLKLDNGPGFASEEMREFLESRGVTLLLSPPRRPSYNGAIERSVGVLKADTKRCANERGEDAEWLDEDLERARWKSNARPSKCDASICRADVWKSRTTITKAERANFLGEVSRQRVELIEAEGYARDEISRRTRNAIDRKAISRVLCAHGILHHRSRRINELIPRLLGAEMAQG